MKWKPIDVFKRESSQTDSHSNILWNRHSNYELLNAEIHFFRTTEAVALANAVKKTKERECVFSTFFIRSENTIISIKKSNSFNQFLTGSSSSKTNFEELALAIARAKTI